MKLHKLSSKILLNMFQVDGSGRELIRVGGQESESFKSHQQSLSQQTVKVPDWCSALGYFGQISHIKTIFILNQDVQFLIHFPLIFAFFQTINNVVFLGEK